ncbi:hypothetical protein NN561_015032 [Cricetulus griseus]
MNSRPQHQWERRGETPKFTTSLVRPSLGVDREAQRAERAGPRMSPAAPRLSLAPADMQSSWNSRQPISELRHALISMQCAGSHLPPGGGVPLHLDQTSGRKGRSGMLKPVPRRVSLANLGGVCTEAGQSTHRPTKLRGNGSLPCQLAEELGIFG